MHTESSALNQGGLGLVARIIDLYLSFSFSRRKDSFGGSVGNEGLGYYG
jgi:hypothetical protein